MEYDLGVLEFVPDLYKISNHSDNRIVWIPLKIPDRQTLFNILASDLDFPQYFGHNWDALYDLLCDLSWISQRRIVIIHEDLPFQLTDKERRTYLGLLIDAVKRWGPRENHELAVIFPLRSQETIRDLLNYLLISITLKPQASISIIAMSLGNRVYCAAKSEVHSLEELRALTSIQPTKTWRKGERRGKLPRHSGFEVRPVEKETGDVEEKLHVLLDILLPFQSDLRALSMTANIGIYIAYYGYQQQMRGIHLEEETIKKLAELNLSVDIDLYASGTDLKSCE